MQRGYLVLERVASLDRLVLHRGSHLREVKRAAVLRAEQLGLFFDRETQVISYVDITNNGYVSRGEMAFGAGAFTGSGQQVQPDGSSYSIRVALTHEEDGTMVNRLWNLEGDIWVANHTIIYTLDESDD